MDILLLKSKEKLGCNRCEKCCIYRGDIRLTPINVCEISQFLNISIKEFLEQYTNKLKGEEPELVLRTRGELKECILYSRDKKGCSIHPVKPMQCVMFPLVPENLKRDYFYNSNQCVIKDAKPISVNRWLNGNHHIYRKNKKICMEWIAFVEWIQPLWYRIPIEKQTEIYKILFEKYQCKKNLKWQMRKNIEEVKQCVIKEGEENC